MKWSETWGKWDFTDSNVRLMLLPLGCLRWVILFMTISFFVAFFKNCNGRGVYESAIQTTKDYVTIADSIWHQ